MYNITYIELYYFNFNWKCISEYQFNIEVDCRIIVLNINKCDTYCVVKSMGK